jgi:hypothetical protein
MMRRGVQALLSILLLALAIVPDASAQFFSRSFSIPPDSGELQLIKFEKQSDQLVEAALGGGIHSHRKP